MIKCAFCEYSCPIGGIGGWKCYYDNNVEKRLVICKNAIKTMTEYNNTRAMKVKNEKGFGESNVVNMET